MESSVQVLVIGAGIVGCSATHHRARRGTADVAAVEQALQPATGGLAPEPVPRTSSGRTRSGRTTSRQVADADGTSAILELDEESRFHRVGGIAGAAARTRWDDLGEVALGHERRPATHWGTDRGLPSPCEVHDRIPQIVPEMTRSPC